MLYKNNLATLVCKLLVTVLVALGADSQACSHQSSQVAEPSEQEAADFYFDPGDEIVDATLFANPLLYDAHVVVHERQAWFAWLEFTPGKGDQIWIGRREAQQWAERTLISKDYGQFARPTLTVDSTGHKWLSYETLKRDQWEVMVVSLSHDKATNEPIKVSTGASSDIHHRVAADSHGNLWIVWQSDRDGQFDVVARKMHNGVLGQLHVVGDHSGGDWHPSIAVDNQGTVHVVWDAYDGESFNVYLRTCRKNSWSETRIVADTAAFEGRAQIIVDATDRAWIAWEEGGDNWGKPYRGIKTELISDHQGPLHRFRQLRIGVLNSDGSFGMLTDALPLPSIRLAEERRDRRSSLERTGAFYERIKLTVDSRGRPWIVYRHNYTPWLGIDHRSHIEEGWGLYARYYGADGWSKLYRLNVGQGDGMQRLELTPNEDGITAVWTTGRTHRDRNQRPRGLMTATIVANSGTGVRAPNLLPTSLTVDHASSTSKEDSTVSDNVTSQQYQLFYGDLHRHTDLSLCRVPIDGTIDDAYRYAIEVAQLDFLGITDHSRDIAQGDPLSQLWWRSRKEVLRHQLGTDFIPFFAYERSHGNTADHNVISLRGDMLRPHTYPLPDFWSELDRDTITIAHQPIRRDTWNYQNDDLRPLAEIFQGCRDNSIEEDVHRGLARGYHFGFIASSDHMSTSASYACVWAPEATRESIFRAMQARRTFGATDKIRLLVKAGTHWMGEIVTAGQMPPLTLEAYGTAPIRNVHLIVDGKTEETSSPNERNVQLSRQLELTGKHYVYFHLVQNDGNEAWSSPIWLNIGNE